QPETLNNSIHQPLRLPGQFEDELTGIVQNRFRDYDPKIGRYLTPDPIGLNGGLNNYRYTRNPVDYIDRLGLAQEASVTAKNAGKGPEAALDTTPAPAMSEVPEGEGIGLKKNADGDLILCVGEEACADPSNVEDAGWGDLATWGAMLLIERLPVRRILDKVPLPKGAKDKLGKDAEEVVDPKVKPKKVPDKIVPKKMEPFDVPCFTPGAAVLKSFSGNKKKMEKEFYKQIKGQEDGINNLTVGEYLENRNKYSELGRHGVSDGKAQKNAGKKLHRKLTEKFKKEIVENDIATGKEATNLAKARADKSMKSLAALHDPDMIAGGHDKIKVSEHKSGMGNTNVNSSIGSQWKTRVDGMDEAAKKALKEKGPDAKMNVNVSRCKV
uniref:polymorphic toxin type 15 domain-containing protein n=1 Tax=Marinobacter sp. TaxID=50741 RepID=UPI003A958510